MSEAEAKALVNKADQDSNKGIDFSEFALLWEALHRRRWYFASAATFCNCASRGQTSLGSPADHRKSIGISLERCNSYSAPGIVEARKDVVPRITQFVPCFQTVRPCA